MELKTKLIQFKVCQQLPLWLLPQRRKQRPIFILSTFREAFPPAHVKWKTLEVHSNSDQSVWQQAVLRRECSKHPELSFNRLQPSEEECSELQKLCFGQFVAREARLDEEYWTAAWLRAEANWESLTYTRHADSYKMKYAEQEFYALKRRCAGRDGNSLKCFCFVAVKKEDKSKRRTVLSSVVGTLDLSIRQLSRGETYPGEVKSQSSASTSQEPYEARRYGYVANVCVSKFARRKGIASNMLLLATDFAKSSGMKQLFIHVDADNHPAQELYTRVGFEFVEAASSPLSKDQKLLMSMELKSIGNVYEKETETV